eukprot:COSAG06_NODE_454_length_15536_cov_23.174257_2_plen_71_part_00
MWTMRCAVASKVGARERSQRQRAHRCRPRIFHISQDLADAGRASNFGTPIPAPLAQGRLALDPDQRALPV